MIKYLLAFALFAVPFAAHGQGQIGPGHVLGNPNAGAHEVQDTSLSSLFDQAFCSQNYNGISRLGGSWVCDAGLVVSLGGAPTRAGSCTSSTPIGGGTAGTFVAGVCAGGTFILTFSVTTPNGWVCHAEDRTTPTNTVRQTASSVVTATFVATTTASDVIQFACVGY